MATPKAKLLCGICGARHLADGRHFREAVDRGFGPLRDGTAKEGYYTTAEGETVHVTDPAEIPAAREKIIAAMRRKLRDAFDRIWDAATRQLFAETAREHRRFDLAHRIEHADSTRLSERRGIQRRLSAEDRSYFRDLLRQVPSLPGFGDVLTAEETQTWLLRFDAAQFSQAEVANKVGKTQREISRFLSAAAARFNARYLELRSTSAWKPPMQFDAFILKMREYDPALPEYDFASSFELFRKADRLGAGPAGPRDIELKEAADEVADSIPGGISIRGGGRPEVARGTPKEARR